jgi:cytidylate kinase
MLALTVDGQAGAGGPELGMRMARALGARYVERLAFKRLARQLRASPAAVTRKELGFSSMGERFKAQLELMFARMGWYGADWSMGADPPWDWYVDRPAIRTMPAEITDAEYHDAIHSVAGQFVEEGQDVLLVKRAGCVTLRDAPGVVHIGLFANRDHRVARLRHRLRVGVLDAEDALDKLERARAAWFMKLGDVHPEDPDLYTARFRTGAVDSDEDVVQEVIGVALEMGYDMDPMSLQGIVHDGGGSLATR